MRSAIGPNGALIRQEDDLRDTQCDEEECGFDLPDVEHQRDGEAEHDGVPDR